MENNGFFGGAFGSSGSSGGGGGGGDTIYTANSSLTGNRTVDLGGNTLTFNNGNSSGGVVNTFNGRTAFVSNRTSSEANILEVSDNSNDRIFEVRENNSVHINAQGTGDVVLGANAQLGTEKISLQGWTLIKGEGTSTGSALAIYDNDTTPNKLWDFLDNGSLNGNKSKTTLTAQNTTANDLTQFVFSLKSQSGNDLMTVANDGYFQFGASNGITGGADYSECFQVGKGNSITSNGSNKINVGIGNLISGATKSDQFIFGKSNTSNGNDQILLGQSISGGAGSGVSAVGNITTLTGSYSCALASYSNNLSNYSGIFGVALESTANGAFVIGYGDSANFNNKLVNSTANSLALGWNSTTPQHLFKNTGVSLTIPTASTGLSSSDLWNENGVVRIGTSGGAIGGNTIYTADDSLVDNRTINLNGKNLTFQKVSSTTEYTKIYRNGGLEIRGSGFDTGNDVFKVKYRASGNDLLAVGQNGGVTIDSSISMGQFNATWNYGQQFSDGYIKFYHGATWNDNEAIRFDLRNNTDAFLSFNRNGQGTSGNRFVVRNSGLAETNYGTSKEQISLQGNTLIKGDTGLERTSYNFKVANSSLEPSFMVFNNKDVIVGASTKVSTEIISLQGSTLIKGDGTSTGSTLALYNSDTTPVKTWDFLDNGNVSLGVDSVLSIGSNDLDINGSGIFSLSNGTRSISSQWNTHTIINLNNGNGTTYSLYSGNTSTTFDEGQFGIGVGSNIPFRIFNGSSVALGNVGKGSLDTNYNVQTAGATLIGGNLDTKLGTNEISLDHTNYPKLKISNGTNEYWLIEGDGTGSTFDTGDLYLYDQTNSQKILQFKQSNNSLLFSVNLDMNNNRITNTIVNPSVQETTSTATFTINSDQQTDAVLTAMAVATTIASPTGTPVQSQNLVFRFKDDGTARAITWNAIFRAIGITLPTTTTASKLLYVGCKYNSTDTKWDVVSVQEEA